MRKLSYLIPSGLLLVALTVLLPGCPGGKDTGGSEGERGRRAGAASGGGERGRLFAGDFDGGLGTHRDGLVVEVPVGELASGLREGDEGMVIR